MHDWHYFRKGRILERFDPSKGVHYFDRTKAQWVRDPLNEAEPLFNEPDYNEIAFEEAKALTSSRPEALR
jgi:hypothetical protein